MPSSSINILNTRIDHKNQKITLDLHQISIKIESKIKKQRKEKLIPRKTKSGIKFRSETNTTENSPQTLWFHLSTEENRIEMDEIKRKRKRKLHEDLKSQGRKITSWNPALSVSTRERRREVRRRRMRSSFKYPTHVPDLPLSFAGNYKPVLVWSLMGSCRTVERTFFIF